MNAPRGLRTIAVAVALSLAGAQPAAARDVERTEAVGVVPLRGDRPASELPRDEAIQRALSAAVLGVAAALLPAGTGADAGFALEESLGDDPFEFITRFQVIEDRGVGPALFTSDPDVETEYVVVVDAEIDRDRVRMRLAESGLLAAPSGQPPRLRMLLTLEGLTDYRVYEAVRDALVVGLGVRSATPLEAEQGRMTLEIDSRREPADLLVPLQQAVPPHLQLILLAVDGDSLTLRVEVGELTAPSLAAPRHPD